MSVCFCVGGSRTLFRTYWSSALMVNPSGSGPYPTTGGGHWDATQSNRVCWWLSDVCRDKTENKGEDKVLTILLGPETETKRNRNSSIVSSGRALSTSDLHQISEKWIEVCTAKVRLDDQTQLATLWSYQAWPTLYRQRRHWLLTRRATQRLNPGRWGQAKTPRQTLLSGSWEGTTQSRARSRTDVCWMDHWRVTETREVQTNAL